MFSAAPPGAGGLGTRARRWECAGMTITDDGVSVVLEEAQLLATRVAVPGAGLP